MISHILGAAPARAFTLASARERQLIAQLFRFESDAQDELVVRVLEQPKDCATSTILWERICATANDRDGITQGFHANPGRFLCLCRMAASFGSAILDQAAADFELEHRQKLETKQRKQEEKRRQWLIIRLYATEDTHGFYLELRRDSERKTEWKIAFRGRAERERMRDYLRWQQPRFGDYLRYAEEHGWEALSRLVIDEMFEVERWVKAEGKSAGGARPLRFWRGQ